VTEATFPDMETSHLARHIGDKTFQETNGTGAGDHPQDNKQNKIHNKHGQKIQNIGPRLEEDTN